MELERFTRLSVFSRPAFVSGLMVASAKNLVHSVLKTIRRTNHIVVSPLPHLTNKEGLGLAIFQLAKCSLI
jgi:hypothetical protein